jgi:DNA-binding HxlR family transcriptional regulator
LKVLEVEGLINRVVAAGDPAQVTVCLTVKALEAMDGYFSESP